MINNYSMARCIRCIASYLLIDLLADLVRLGVDQRSVVV
jgi:hypothetical protein